MQFTHEEAGRSGRFTLTEAGNTAELSYTVRPETRTLAFDHTFVPTAARGQGLARKIVDHAVEHARQAGMKIAPHCSYVSVLFDRNPTLYGDVDARKAR